jgi:hypothetical protein
MSKSTNLIVISTVGLCAIVATILGWSYAKNQREVRRVQEISDRHRDLYSRFLADDVAEIRCAVGVGRAIVPSTSSENMNRHPVLGKLLRISLASPIGEVNYDPSVVRWADDSAARNEVLTYAAFDRDGKVVCSTNITLVESMSFSPPSGTLIPAFACVVERESMVSCDGADVAALRNTVNSLSAPVSVPVGTKR